MGSTSAEVKAYRHTINGLVTLIYANQKMTSKKAGRPLPSYTKEELKDWMTSQPNFSLLWDNWVCSGYDKSLSPSVDREDNTLSYFIGNIQLVTWEQNLKNQKQQNKSGEYLHTGSKAIKQYSLDGEFLKEFPSASIAAREITGKSRAIANISSAAKGRMKTAYGFIWKYSNALS